MSQPDLAICDVVCFICAPEDENRTPSAQPWALGPSSRGDHSVTGKR